MKILVVGYSSSGKSTFSKRLSKHYGIDVLHIDTIFFGPNWIKRDPKEVEQEIYDFMYKKEWIIDGQYRHLATERYEQCDQLFLFDFNRFKCLYGAIKRRIKYHNQNRDSIAKGCKERLNLSFLWWILFSGRKKDSKALMKLYKQKYKHKAIVFKNRRQVNKYLKSIDYKGSLEY
jgi:adenylate kinase family enzyme